ncbi:hypothetical protein [Erythrobacter sp.]|uniref:hypothetical protein n=1 Tax=Erythrobacter sp. TaxID=1042 RepID=UPI001425D3A1|nr:hypothetical protein [Erythrobacter sp.]QIQ87244.1 MAG: hypothetical protein G9473_11530 [Erythrobacter sp.]
MIFSATSILSSAWLVLHARDVVLVLRQVLPIDPGEGKRLASFRLVCAMMTLFGFSVSAETLILLRASLGS